MKKPITIVSSICSLIFLIAIIIFTAGIYKDKKNGSQKAEARYQALLNATKENFASTSYGSSEFSLNFIRAIGDINDFSSLKLEINGTLVYSYPPSSFTLPSPELVKSYSDSVNVAGKNFTLTASIYLVTPGIIYNHSRLAFLMILIGTLIAGIYIVFTSGSGESQSLSENTYFKKSRLAEESERQPSIKKETKPAVIETEKEQESEEKKSAEERETTDEKNEQTSVAKEESISITFPEESPIFTEEDEQEWNNEELFDNETKEESNENMPAAEELDIIDQLEKENEAMSDDDLFADVFEDENKQDLLSDSMPIPEEKQDPETVVSPITNLHLQSQLEEQLDAVVASNSEATLSLLKINGLDRGNSISQEIISILKTALPNSDLFEYKADSYAIIAETNLQDTVDKFEEIYNQVSDYLKDNNAVNEVSVGISSASGRNIKAARIILEASQALDYASQDPDSPIVAFRANPQKYKEFIENQD